MGLKIFLDTNAIIALLKGNKFLKKKLSDASWIGTSAIVVIEFLSFSILNATDKATFEKFINRIEVIGISNKLISLHAVALFRKKYQA